MKRIAITFAGRQDRMQAQLALMQKCIANKQIDEWHIWDFSRQDSDRVWLEGLVNQQLSYITYDDSVDYVPVKQHFTNAKAIIRGHNDAHLLLELNGKVHEIVLGAFSNTKSLLREFASLQTYRLNAVAVQESDAVLLEGDNHIELTLREGECCLQLNEKTVFSMALDSSCAHIERLSIHSGYGAIMTWDFFEEKPSSIKLIKQSLKSYQGFRFLYHYYCHQYFAEDVFVKLDDDIVYIDTTELDGFFQCVQNTAGVSLVSANVINNGVCAYLQQQKGYLDGINLEFEYPKHGTCGSLWESADKCTQLHDYFLANFEAILNTAKTDEQLTVLPRADRFSINFVGFKQPLFMYMGLGGYQSLDDEEVMTQVLPKTFGVSKYVYNHLMVSHLSFFKQDEGLEIDVLMKKYGVLLNQVLKN